MSLPKAARPFVDFPAVLRAHGFAVAPDQTMGFIEAVELLGPRSMADIRRAAVAMLAIPKEREAEFDALFRAFFFGQTISAPAISADDEEVDAHEAGEGEREVEEGDDLSEIGMEATGVERLAHRAFQEIDQTETLRRFSRLAPSRLPRRLSYRRMPAKRGDALNMRRTLRDAVRRDGETFTLAETRRKSRQRRLVLLIDVSGSMKERSEDSLRFAHALVRAAERVEVFTLGTRLTRITPALKAGNRDVALARVAALVADFDGGTRIGEALQAFLAVPRFAGFARGAAVVVLSDGLERGDPTAMREAVRRLSRSAWRVDWLSPLAGLEGYRPETAALAGILPHLDSLADGSHVGALCDAVLGLADHGRRQGRRHMGYGGMVAGAGR